MDEEAPSWIRRTKFSHTVCHRLDSAGLFSVPVQQNRIANLKSRPQQVIQNPKPGPDLVHVQRNPLTNRQRAISPSPQTKLPASFTEARSEQKRFSTPHPQRKEGEKGKFSKIFHRNTGELRAPSIKSPESRSSRNSSPLRHFTSLKFHDKIKSRKDSGWTKYFDRGGRVTSVETADDHMIDRSQLLIGQKFAHGAHSQLYRGRYMDEDVALKLIQVPYDDENGDLASRLERQFTREVTLLARLHHPNVVKFVAALREPLTFCIVTEYVSEGCLRAYLHKLERKPLDMQKLISMALDIARGMEYIHSQGIIHRDLKPENVLIAHDFHLKIADLGIACEEASCDFLADDPGTYRWMAPEMIKRKHYGRKVDVYGFGLILWEFVSGTIPYEDMTPIQAAFAVVNKNSRPAVPRDCAPAMKSLIEQCWSLQPDKRPEFWQIVKVLEEFESALARDGNLKMVQNLALLDHKKGLRHWIHKLSPTHQATSSMPKPKLM